MWAAYRKGLELPEIPGALAAEPFKFAFEQMVLSNFDLAWTLFAEADGKYQPVGVAVGFDPHPKWNAIILNGVWWFPWASPRNKVEVMADFFSNVRREMPMLGFAERHHQAFYDVMCKHGLLRRIGTSHSSTAIGPAAVYETRWEQ